MSALTDMAAVLGDRMDNAAGSKLALEDGPKPDTQATSEAPAETEKMPPTQAPSETATITTPAADTSRAKELAGKLQAARAVLKNDRAQVAWGMSGLSVLAYVGKAR